MSKRDSQKPPEEKKVDAKPDSKKADQSQRQSVQALDKIPESDSMIHETEPNEDHGVASPGTKEDVDILNHKSTPPSNLT